MGKPSGFMEHHRQAPERRSTALRVLDYGEIYTDQAAGTTREQASRCMDCGVPFCHQGCPLGNEIPDFNDLLHRGQWREAYQRLASTNNFPELTGRLCPAPCEAACVLAINDDPVTIEQIEKQLVERAFAEGWIEAESPPKRTDEKVAIVGSGPAGLAAAAQLNSAGHRVTVYEAADRIGGLLRYGIPDFKLERHVLDRRLALMKAAGVKFVTDTRVGESPTWAELRESHDAVLVAIGAGSARDLQVPGRELHGVHFAMDYLEQQNRVVAGSAPADADLDARGRDVIILGGGDTGADCLGTALRQDARSVRQIELLPQPPEQRRENNPWPQWPLVDRLSPAHEEGGQREFGVLTKRLEGERGGLTTLHAIRVDVSQRAGGDLDIREIPGTEVSLAADMLLLALGFTGPQADTLVEELGAATDQRGNIAIDDRFMTSIDGLFCAGDARRGQSLIVWAIADGREAARAVDSYLSGGPTGLPTRGVDSPFGGR